MEEIIAADFPIATSLLGDLNSTLKDVTTKVNNLIEKIKNDNYNTDKGISLLELKNHTLMSYLTDLSYVTKRKLNGLSINNEPCIDRLVETRVTLERIRPMEDKLKYQIEKYAKIAKEGIAKEDDPSRMSGDLDNIVMSSDEDDSDADGGKGEKSRKMGDEDKIYKVPKISQTHYPGEEEGTDKKKDRERKRALSSAMIQDAISEYTDDPTVIHNTDVLKEKVIRKRKEIEKYEEDNMIRINLTKKDKTELKRMTTLGSMKKELLSFHNMDALDPDAPNAKKSKSSSFKGSKKKGKAKGKKGFKKRR